jgi:hypothetical protein
MFVCPGTAGAKTDMEDAAAAAGLAGTAGGRRDQGAAA